MPSKQKDGSVIWDTVGIDITKRKKAEEELAQINKNLEQLVEERAQKAINLSRELERYYLVAEHAKTGVWHYDVRDNSLIWDNIMYDLYGIDKESFSGAYEAWETSLHPDDIEPSVKALQVTIENQVDFDTSFRIIHQKTGQTRYIRAKAKVELDNEGNTIAVFGTNYDITKEMQLAVEKEEIINQLKIYKTAAQNAMVGVWYLDIKQNYALWDDTEFAIFGLNKEDFKDNNVPFESFLRTIEPEFVPLIQKALRESIEDGKPMDLMYKIKTLDTNQIKYIRVKAEAQFDDEGNVIAVFGTDYEITKEMELVEERQLALNKLKATQSHLIQSEKMASLGVLTAGVAHELNNPLNYISGGINAIREELRAETNFSKDNLLEYLEWIDAGFHRSAEIVKGLNLFSRENKEKVESCNIHEIIEDCLLMLRNKYFNKVDIIKDFTSEEVIVKGNNGKLHQAFLNLIANAIDAIPLKGKIEINTFIKSGEVYISIIDNGTGISEEDINKVMDPFYTTKSPGKGTGLGLYITYSIIKDHEGIFNITSDVGKGTKVEVSLPL